MKTRFLICTIAALALLTACKTTEANYRNAYDTVVAHQREKSGDPDTPELQSTGTAATRQVEIAQGITVPVTTVWLSVTKEADVTPVKDVRKYNVTVARFRQAFNARQMLGRLHNSGYPSALILKTNDAYYVATSTTASPDSAAAAMRAAEADTTMRLRPPFPYILIPAHLNR